MDIRPIQSHELHHLLALYAHLHTSDDPLPDEATVQSTWQELVGNPRYPYLLAHADGKQAFIARPA